MQQVEVRLSAWLEQGFNLFKNNLGVLVLSSLIMLLLSMVTLGILAGPLLAGLVLIILRIMDPAEAKPEVGDLFKGFEYFLQAFLFLLLYVIADVLVSMVLSVVPVLGFLASMFFSIALSTAAMFTIFLIVNQRMDFWPAFLKSFETVKTNFWMFMAFNVILQVAIFVGAMLCGIGLLFALPFAYCAVAVAYCEVFGNLNQEEAAPEAATPDRDAGFPPPSTEAPQ